MAVVGVDDEQMGQQSETFVVVKPGSSISPDDINEYVHSRLARYKIPRRVVFVDDVPRNSTGKILRKPLRERDDPFPASRDGSQES